MSSNDRHVCSGFIMLIVESPSSVGDIWWPPCVFGFLCVNCSVLILGGYHQMVAMFFSGFSVLIVVFSCPEMSSDGSVTLICATISVKLFYCVCVNYSVLFLGRCHLMIPLHASVPPYQSSCTTVSKSARWLLIKVWKCLSSFTRGLVASCYLKI